MKKRFLALILALAMAFAMLTGCGNSSSSSSDSSAAGDSSSSSSDGVIQLNFPSIWVGSDSKADVFGKIVEGFNEEYAGKYEIVIEEQTDYDLYADKLRTQITTGDAPDIFTLDNYADLELFAESGKLMDLTDFLAQDEISELFLEGAVEGATVDGVSYGFPYENAVIPLMYNERLLDAAGVEAFPTTFEELWDLADALESNGIYPFTLSTADNAWFAMLWYSYAVAAAGGPDVYENGLDDPAFVEAAEIIQKIFQHTSSDAVGADATVANGHFFNERSGLYTNGSWILGRIQSEGVEGLYDNLGISPGLSLNGENGNSYISQVQAYFAAAKQDDPAKQEAVEAFFTYILDPDRVLELSISSGSLFAIKVDSTQYEDPIQSEIVAQSNDASFTIGHFEGSVSTAVAEEFPSALESLVLGDVDAQGFVDLLKAADQ